MKKIFGINLARNQVQLSCMEYDPKDFDRTDEQVRFRVIENKDFLADIYYVYNGFVNNFDIQIDNQLYKKNLRRTCLINNIVWLYMSQLETPELCEKELNKQRLIFQNTKVAQEKTKNVMSKTQHEKSFHKKTSIAAGLLLKKTNSKNANKSRIYSEKSLDNQSITDVEEFNIFEEESVKTLPSEIDNFQVRLRSDFFEEKMVHDAEEHVRFIGDDGFIAKVERKYLKGIDRAGEILEWERQPQRHGFRIQRDKLISIREVFKDFLEKIVEYIRNKYKSGKELFWIGDFKQKCFYKIY
jgi:hypothetical protein